MGNVIYLVRHTPVGGMEGICYGQSDVALSSDFGSVANRVKQKLAGVRLDKLISSPLTRCRLLASVLQESYQTDSRLMETNFGEWELLTWNEIYETPEGKVWFDDYLNQSPPEGESFRMLIGRISQFIKEQIPPEGAVVIVTHAGPVRAFLVAMGLVTIDQAFDVKPDYGEVIKIENNSYNFITL